MKYLRTNFLYNNVKLFKYVNHWQVSILLCWTRCVTQVGLKLIAVLLAQLLKCWEYMGVPLRITQIYTFKALAFDSCLGDFIWSIQKWSVIFFSLNLKIFGKKHYYYNRANEYVHYQRSVSLCICICMCTHVVRAYKIYTFNRFNSIMITLVLVLHSTC